MNEIARQRIERIARKFYAKGGLSGPVFVSPILGKGFVNEVWTAEADGRKVIVRLNAEDSRAADIYRKEQWCMEQAALMGILGPSTLDSGAEDGVPYAIQTFEEGVNGLESSENPLALWRRIGQYARLIHTIPVQGYGEEFADSQAGAFDSPPHPGSDGSWQGYIRYNIDSLNEEDPLLKLGVISKDQSEPIRRMFERLAERDFRFGLNHGDLSLKNVLADEGRVVLLDWGSAEVYPVPYGDLLQLILTQWRDGTPSEPELQAYREGYGLSDEEMAEADELLLLRAFDKLRWAIDCSPKDVEEYAAFAGYAVSRALGLPESE